MTETQAKTPEEIRAEIERTREELGATVEELAAKTDVKAQARAQADALKASIHEKRDELTERGGHLVGRAREAMPDSAQEGAQQVAGAVRQRPVPSAAIGSFAGGLLLGWLLGRRGT